MLTDPPVRADFGKTQLIPDISSLLTTNSTPSMRMVGKVGGIATKMRSTYMMNMSKLEV